MLIQETMSNRSTNTIQNLDARFQARLVENHHLNTPLGFFRLLFYAIKNLCFSPSAYLAKKSKEGLHNYVNTVRQIRKELIEIDHGIKAAYFTGNHDVRINSHDGQLIEFKIQTFINDGRVGSAFYLKNDANEWELQPFTYKEFLDKIEQDILDNPRYFDKRLVASCKLTAAVKVYENLQTSLTEEARANAAQQGKQHFEPIGQDQIVEQLDNPENPHCIELVHKIEEIVENLLEVAFYESELHPDEPACNKSNFVSLATFVNLFISKNLDHILFGRITNANGNDVAKCIKILTQVLRDRFSEDVRNKLAFIEKFTDCHIGGLTFNSTSNSLMFKYLQLCRENTDAIKLSDLRLAKEIIGKLPRDADPGHPLPVDFASCRQLHDELAEVLLSSVPQMIKYLQDCRAEPKKIKTEEFRVVKELIDALPNPATTGNPLPAETIAMYKQLHRELSEAMFADNNPDWNTEDSDSQVNAASSHRINRVNIRIARPMADL